MNFHYAKHRNLKTRDHSVFELLHTTVRFRPHTSLSLKDCCFSYGPINFGNFGCTEYNKRVHRSLDLVLNKEIAGVFTLYFSF